MARRVTYGSASVYAGPNATTGNLSDPNLNQLSRVQSYDLSFTPAETTVSQMGNDIFTDAEVGGPTVEFGLNYFTSNGWNENAVDLVVDGTSGAFSKLKKNERHIFVHSDGEFPATTSIGHAALVGYDISCGLKEPMAATLSFQALNANIQTGNSGFTPEINLKNGIQKNTFTYDIPNYDKQLNEPPTGNLSTNIINRPSAISLSYPSGSAFGSDINDEAQVFVKDFSLSASIPRTSAATLSYKYPIVRPIDYPIQVSVSATLEVTRREADDFRSAIQSDGDIKLEVQDDNYSEPVMAYTLKGAKLVSYGETLSIDNSLEVTLNWQTPIGRTSTKNLYISGYAG